MLTAYSYDIIFEALEARFSALAKRLHQAEYSKEMKATKQRELDAISETMTAVRTVQADLRKAAK